MTMPLSLIRPLFAPRIQAVLERLYVETVVNDPGVRQAARDLGLHNDGQPGFYTAMRDAKMPVVPEFGALLYILARSVGAKYIVEFGTSFGLSTIFLASAIRDNGGGRIVRTEFLPEKAEQARINLAETGLDDLVEIRVGEAQHTLIAGLDGQVDLLFLDATKGLYLDILRLMEPHLRHGALVVSDRSDLDGDPNARDAAYLAYLRDPANGYRTSSIATRALDMAFEHEIAVRY
jgi:predicted O-methyltransferase YrrM